MKDDSDKNRTRKTKKVLAIASGGGHWVQLLRLRPAFEGCKVIYATTKENYACDLEAGAEFYVVPDCNRWEKWKLVKGSLSILKLIITQKPDIVVSTGAAPGFLAIRFAKLFGKKTIWLDSIANAEELSLSGQKAKNSCDMWMTQWEHLAKVDGPIYRGNILGD
ncbi:hypothetical protein [Pelagicoccus sp. SDUM812002]|uniref:hypothetical protein n=1 Tax=Pelagicoccus sp. SDUM812002 TaxID=3041266 RepID=UPI00280EB381|nr:hypothetical protein [Pelagicoccus sp. SDUM812002]MDQ8188065.1 hypothetical protein [Pelagicoccus sp. SDUM812002]